MTPASRLMRWTVADYTAMENESPIKHEFFNGDVFAMAGASPLHNEIAGSALVALGRQRAGCKVFTSDQRIYIPATGLYTYADGGVVCGKWRIHTDGLCLMNPLVLVEVLSPSTRDYDKGAKREHYQQIPTLRHLLLIDQPARFVRHCSRRPDGGWDTRDYTSGVIELNGLADAVALEDLYPAEDSTPADGTAPAR